MMRKGYGVLLVPLFAGWLATAAAGSDLSQLESINQQMIDGQMGLALSQLDGLVNANPRDKSLRQAANVIYLYAGIGDQAEAQRQLALVRALKESSLGQRQTQSSDLERTLTQLINAWKAAWEAGDIDAYMAFYAQDFSTPKRKRKAFRRHKKRVFAGAGKITVGISDLKIDSRENTVRARFVQDYSSAKLTDRGVKTLIFTKTSEGFKIAHESWTATK